MSSYLKLDGDENVIEIKTAYEEGGRFIVVIPNLTLSALAALKNRMTIAACSTLRLVGDSGEEISDPFIGYRNQTNMEIVQSMPGSDPLFEVKFVFEKDLSLDDLSEKLSQIHEINKQIEELQNSNAALSNELTMTQSALVEEFESRLKLQQDIDMIRESASTTLDNSESIV